MLATHLPCYTAAHGDLDSVDCTADLGTAFREHAVPMAALVDCVLLGDTSALPRALTRPAQLWLLSVGVAYTGAPAVAAFLTRAAGAAGGGGGGGAVPDAPALAVLEAVSGMLRPTPDVVAAACGLLPAVHAAATQGRLASDDGPHLILLSVTAMVGRLRDAAAGAPAGGAAGTDRYEEVLAVCGAHLSATLAVVNAREAAVAARRANATAAVEAGWAALHPRRQVNELLGVSFRTTHPPLPTHASVPAAPAMT
jgi:hypothetical protein